jgi:hypothetical protein
MKLALALIVALASNIASAETIKILHSHDEEACPSRVCIDGLGLNAAKNTGWINMLGYSAISFQIQFVDSNDSVTKVRMECEVSHVSSTTSGSGTEICSGLTAAGATEYTCPHYWDHTTGTAENWQINIGSVNADWINCIFTATGTPAAADVVTVRMLKRTP